VSFSSIFTFKRPQDVSFESRLSTHIALCILIFKRAFALRRWLKVNLDFFSEDLGTKENKLMNIWWQHCTHFLASGHEPRFSSSELIKDVFRGFIFWCRRAMYNRMFSEIVF
jgi:hypothetical protein